jgi:hypothetical protein
MRVSIRGGEAFGFGSKSIGSISIRAAWIFQSRMPSSLANRFFPASTARSRLRADRMMIERWQQWKSLSFLGISLMKLPGICRPPDPLVKCHHGLAIALREE